MLRPVASEEDRIADDGGIGFPEARGPHLRIGGKARVPVDSCPSDDGVQITPSLVMIPVTSDGGMISKHG